MERPEGLTGAEMIAWERNRQILEEYHDAEHDDRHTNDGLIDAAICYAVNKGSHHRGRITWTDGDLAHWGLPYWPWAPEHDKRKKHGRIKSLTIAGALIAAEIDRELRKEQSGAE